VFPWRRGKNAEVVLQSFIIGEPTGYTEARMEGADDAG